MSDPRTPADPVVTSEPASTSPSDGYVDHTGPSTTTTPGHPKKRPTRTGAVWGATIALLLLGVLTLIFILQNGQKVRVDFLWMSGSLALGVALLIAAVAGGGLVALAGISRLVAVRRSAKKRARA